MTLLIKRPAREVCFFCLVLSHYNGPTRLSHQGLQWYACVHYVGFKGNINKQIHNKKKTPQVNKGNDPIKQIRSPFRAIFACKGQ